MRLQRSFAAVGRRFVPAAALLSLLFVASFLYLQPEIGFRRSSPIVDPEPQATHPIDRLVRGAHAEWQRLLTRESHDLESAVAQYRARRGRHPPPGFAEWFKYAKSSNAIIVEDFFDQIYHDLNPFWGLSPSRLRQQTQGFEQRIVVRDHNATMVTDIPRDWMDTWFDLVQSIQQYLPDLDMPINVMDESRIIVPWDDLTRFVHAEESSRQLLPPAELTTEYTRRNDSREMNEQSAQPYRPEFKGPGSEPYWQMARVACPDDSPSRTTDVSSIDFASPPPEFYNYLNISYHGYVRNWTQTKDICTRPELHALHGTFIEPISISTTHELFPLFGGSKLPVNNEILIPPAMYWSSNEMYSGGDEKHGGPWREKRDQLIWRGAATGGRNRDENWRGFQRHRFLAMLNATAVQLAEQQPQLPHHGANFVLPAADVYDLRSGREGHLAELIRPHADLGFVHLVCFPYDARDPHCSYTEPYFELKKGMDMAEQYAYKYLPDLDGNSFSGRYRAFLLSTSLPIKATIYNEWHDSRLIPWAHFVPMDSTFMDIYGIMEYFLGYKDQKGHDAVAQQIAMDGKQWAEKVLRREDMQIYTYRLLLEYARLCDDQRDRLGYSDIDT